jgi:hypothetical protein
VLVARRRVTEGRGEARDGVPVSPRRLVARGVVTSRGQPHRDDDGRDADDGGTEERRDLDAADEPGPSCVHELLARVTRELRCDAQCVADRLLRRARGRRRELQPVPVVVLTPVAS